MFHWFQAITRMLFVKLPFCFKCDFMPCLSDLYKFSKEFKCYEDTIKFHCYLTHCGLVTHICVSKLTIIGSDNGLSPGRHQAIIWPNAWILLETNFSEILSEIHIFSFKKIHLKMSSGKRRPFCLGLKVLIHCGLVMPYININLDQQWLR